MARSPNGEPELRPSRGRAVELYAASSASARAPMSRYNVPRGDVMASTFTITADCYTFPAEAIAFPAPKPTDGSAVAMSAGRPLHVNFLAHTLNHHQVYSPLNC